MTSSIKQGKLKRWNDAKGFGFIELENENRDVFIHISALKKVARRPVIGDIINFEIHTENDGKKRAVNASIEGVREVKTATKKNNHGKKAGNGWILKLLTPALVAGIAITTYMKFMDSNHQGQTTTSTPSFEIRDLNTGGYSCEGKVYCTEMTSCEEAMFYLNNCQGTKLDGDNDGLPCERQLCGY